MLQSYWIHKIIWIFYFIFRNMFLHCRLTAFNDNCFYLSLVIVHLADKGLIFWGQQAKYYPLMDVMYLKFDPCPLPGIWGFTSDFWLEMRMIFLCQGTFWGIKGSILSQQLGNNKTSGHHILGVVKWTR